MAEALWKRIRGRPVLRGVSFAVRAGDVLGILGPNGAGKSTLLECLSGSSVPDGGSLRFEGLELPTQELNARVTYVAAQLGALPAPEGRTVAEVLETAAPIARVYALVEALQLAPLYRERMESLSYGQRKRVRLAEAFLAGRPLLLLDDPLEGLDVRQARSFLDVLLGLGRESRAVVLTMGSPSEAARVCDQLLVLSQGRVAAFGSLADLRAWARLPEGTPEEVYLALA